MNNSIHCRLGPFAIAVLFSGATALADGDAITYQWPNTPIEIDLKIGSEQRMSIPEAENIHIGIPNEISHQLTSQIIGNHLWLTAIEEFESTRIILIAEPLGRLILQIRAGSSNTSNQPMVFRRKRSNGTLSPKTEIPSHGFVALTRWVVQQLYAPQRLRKNLPGVVRISVDETPANIFRCGARIPTVCGGAVIAIPVGSWQSTYHYATAVHIKNTTPEPIVLDPRELRGPWRAASFLHSRLHPEGKFGDSTVLVLISDFPFENPPL